MKTLLLRHEQTLTILEVIRDQITVMKWPQTPLVKTANELSSSVFQHLCLGFFFYISSIKLNYFLREPGLDEKGPIIQFESTKKAKHCNTLVFWRKKLLIPTALNDGTAIRVAAFLL